VIWKHRDLRFVVGIAIIAASVGSSSAQQLAARADLQQRPDTPAKTSIKSGTETAAAAPSGPPATSDVKPARRFAVKGPYYVDFRARMHSIHWSHSELYGPEDSIPFVEA
jgi:hypothetical protein